MLACRSFLAPLLLPLLGCGGSEGFTVTGAVSLDDQPLTHCVVTFIPEGATGGLGGAGVTGPDGKYTLTSARGGSGIAPGEYKVTFSRFLRPDGSPGDPKIPQIENDASETLPPIYWDRDQTKLKVTVDKDSRVHDFTLTIPGKGP